MAPREGTPLVNSKHFDIRQSSFSEEGSHPRKKFVLFAAVFVGGVVLSCFLWTKVGTKALKVPTGPYQLVECQEGKSFFKHYDFYVGADSLGSAGYNVYVSEERATEINLLNVTTESDGEDYVYMKSAPTEKGPRESIRLEGKKRYNRGLFILDLSHMPAGPGVWPAFWLTDETNWPKNGEIDIVEGINNQTKAKTALHTAAECSMYAHVPSYAKTGSWDRASM